MTDGLDTTSPESTRAGLESARSAVRALAEQFASSEAHYISGAYQEAEARKDFIDKMFKALGWDVDHDRQPDPYRQEVKIEKSDGRHSGRADYAFSLAPAYQRVQFLVEAKRPQANIATPDNCFQIIRYSWPLGLPIGILTDFRSLHVVDTRFRPSIGTASSRVVRSWRLDDLKEDDEFAALYWLLSREAVAEGSIVRFAEAFLPDQTVAQRQYSLFAEDVRAFDDDFLAKLGSWRRQLASIFSDAEPSLSGMQITEAVQRTIDRLVFIRFLEDKQIEERAVIDGIGAGGAAWRTFVRACRRLDGIYNGIVFKQHRILDDPAFAPDESVFVDICDELSNQHSPYNFAAIPIEILGRIYESFLGDVVVKDEAGIRIDRRDDVRKAGGVFYTPQYVVAHMVERTIGAAVDGRPMRDILSYRVIDTSCGSGSFLIGAYDRLLRAALTALPQEGPKTRERYLVERNGELRLAMRAKREILQNCIFGVDIDSQAVEVAQVSLYLKLLSDETTHSAQHQQLEIGAALLPSLARNVVEGNSLVTLAGELFDAETMVQVKSLDFHSAFAKVFQAGGFDLVIGNPPYVKEYTNRSAFDHARSSPYYQGKMDLWYMFACRGLDWLREGGLLAFIATSNWVTNAGASKLREKIAGDARIEELIDFGRFMVFDDAAIQTMILIARKSSVARKYAFRLRRLNHPHPALADAQALLAGQPSVGAEHLLAGFDRDALAMSSFTFADKQTDALLAKIKARCNFQLDGNREIAQGIVPNVDVVTSSGIKHIPEAERASRGVSVGDGVFVVPAGRFPSPTDRELRFLKPCYEPSDVDRYAIRREARLNLIYSKRDVTQLTPLPRRLADHLGRFREIMERRRENVLGRIGFHNLHWPRDERFFEAGPKILSVRKAVIPTFAYVEGDAYVMMAFNVIRTSRVDMLFLTGLLNSAVIKYWLRHKGKMQGAIYQIDAEPLLALPLHVPPAAEQARISGLVAQVISAAGMVAAARTDAEAERSLRLRSEAEERVESAIATLYGLDRSDLDAIAELD